MPKLIPQEKYLTLNNPSEQGLFLTINKDQRCLEVFYFCLTTVLCSSLLHDYFSFSNYTLIATFSASQDK